MWAVKPTTHQQPSSHSPQLHPPPPLQQKIYACSLSIPPISCEGSAEGRADKWTTSEALASRVWCYLGAFFPPSLLRWGVCSGLTGQTEHPATWKPPPGTWTGHILSVHPISLPSPPQKTCRSMGSTVQVVYSLTEPEGTDEPGKVWRTSNIIKISSWRRLQWRCLIFIRDVHLDITCAC